MTKRFRMIAGPNGSGKSTLVGLLRRDYAVNFYTMLNADEIFAEVSKTRAYLPALPFCSRAFFFDNSMLEMRFIAEYSKESGFASVAENTPAWFASHVLAKGAEI